MILVALVEEQLSDTRMMASLITLRKRRGGVRDACPVVNAKEPTSPATGIPERLHGAIMERDEPTSW